MDEGSFQGSIKNSDQNTTYCHFTSCKKSHLKELGKLQPAVFRDNATNRIIALYTIQYQSHVDIRPSTQKKNPKQIQTYSILAILVFCAACPTRRGLFPKTVYCHVYAWPS